MKLIICEKPSVAMEFAKVLGLNLKNRKDGYIEDGDWIITWAVGHLITLSYPEKYDAELKNWNLKTLPFTPNNFLYEPIADVKKQFDIVKGLLKRKDVEVIYNAGDSGREGEYIQRLIFQEAKPNPNAEMRRIWIDSQTEEEIKNGIQNAKLASEYDNLSASAYERAIEDYLAGINFSRAYSLIYGNTLNKIVGTEKYIPIAVGRVMTCVLGMIVERDRLVRNFTQSFSYGVNGEIKNIGISAEWYAVNGSEYFESPLLAKENAFIEKTNAETLKNKLQANGQLCVANIQKTKKQEKAPLLFNLTELQAECSKRYKIDPKETLAITQSLYEKKIVTYPRTDARVISSAVAKEVAKNLSGLQTVTSVSSYVNYILSHGLDKGIENTKYTDDSKITDHYAIIPTGNTSGLGSLNEMELKVFDLITRRFLSIFYPAAEYNKIEVTFNNDKEFLFANATCLNARGYLDVIEYEENENKQEEYNALNNLSVGNILPAEFIVTEKKSTKPKKYTSGTIVLAMEGAGKLVEDAELRAQMVGSGLGTSATRAETIEKLIKNKYITLDKKTQTLSPTELGEQIYTVVNMTEPRLLNPAFTANWEKGLAQIEKGEITSEKYRETLVRYVHDVISKLKTNTDATLINQAMSDIHVQYGGKPVDTSTVVANHTIMGINCPCCGSGIKKVKWGYVCEKYKEPCMFSVGEICGTLISEKDLINVLNGKESSKMKFKSKAGKDFEGTLTLQDDETKGKKVWLKPWN